MHVHRNFGFMHHNWQDRANKKRLLGFHVIFQDGHEQNITGGLSSIPDAIILEHGHVRVAKPIEVEP